MTYYGHIKNGMIVLDDAAPLPEGACVVVQLRDVPDTIAVSENVQRISGIVPPIEDAQRDYYEAMAKKHQ
ncbi:MAG: hypothetical protein GC168_12415 [Candidatus Hydrogenedens sp.]|nr:hypothetical protein [Candidatus Hydrogenedens sp.]